MPLGGLQTFPLKVVCFYTYGTRVMKKIVCDQQDDLGCNSVLIQRVLTDENALNDHKRLQNRHSITGCRSSSTQSILLRVIEDQDSSLEPMHVSCCQASSSQRGFKAVEQFTMTALPHALPSTTSCFPLLGQESIEGRQSSGHQHALLPLLLPHVP